MSERAALETAYLAAVKAHKTHSPRLRLDRDGIYHCTACNPGTWRERAMEVVRRWRRK